MQMCKFEVSTLDFHFLHLKGNAKDEREIGVIYFGKHKHLGTLKPQRVT